MAVRPQSDDPIRFEELWEHREQVRAVCLGIVKDPVEVDDLVQDTYVRALTTSHPPDRRGPIGPWLAVVARHRALDRLRSERDVGGHPGLERTASTIEGPVEHVLQSERRERVRRALTELEARDRELLVRQAVQGLSVSELAAELRTSPAAVRSALWRARRRFRAAVERGGPLGAAPGGRLAELCRRLREVGTRAEGGVPVLAGVGSQLVEALVAVVSAVLLMATAPAGGSALVTTHAAVSSDFPAADAVATAPDGLPEVVLGLEQRESDARLTATADPSGRRISVDTQAGDLGGEAEVEFRPDSTHVDIGTSVGPYAVFVPIEVTCNRPEECSATAALKATADVVADPLPA